MNAKSRLVFSLKERNGILYLLCLMAFTLGIIYTCKQFTSSEAKLDQHQFSEKINKEQEYKKSDFSKSKFNPNYISDYFGYTLGLSTEEIDALHAFRKTGNYVTSTGDFQKITGISDGLLAEISARFRFPHFDRSETKKSKSTLVYPKVIKKLDLNKADSIALTKVYGIGPVLSGRILKYRKLLGGFVEDTQLYEVYGIQTAAAKKVLEKFTVLSRPSVVPKDVNLISLQELSKVPYISKHLARDIIAYRTRVGAITKIQELTKIHDFPAEKINIIEVYLTIK
ncbi:ComEA family DNA-binding protein [Flavobacteriaceae bacterium M23B6Z8]